VKTIKIFAVAVSLFISLFNSVHAGSKNIIYVNGIQNTWRAAEDSRTKLELSINTSSIRAIEEIKKFTVSLVWNPIGWYGTEDGCDLCQDKIELFLMKSAEESYFNEFLNIVLPHNEYRQISVTSAIAVKAYFDDMTPGNNYLESEKKVTDAAMQATKSTISALVEEVKRVGGAIVIAHSQGNLLANLAWAVYSSEIGSEIRKMMRIVNVANTSSISVNGLDLTHARDAALYSNATDTYDKDVSLETLPSQGWNWTRTTPSCFGAACNFYISSPTFGGVDSTGGFLDHGFTDTYLSYTSLPIILNANGVNYSSTSIAFKDRLEDLVYAAASSLEFNQGLNDLLNVEFSSESDLIGWEFTLPWNSTYKTTDYTLAGGTLKLQMLQTDKGGFVLSPSIAQGNKTIFTVRHFMHNGNFVFLPSLWLTNETASPTSTLPIQYIEVGFQYSTFPPDYACSAPDTPRIQDSAGCIQPSKVQSLTNSSSLYEKWITTVMTYDSVTGLLEIDYENDGVLDFVGTVGEANRFRVSRIAIGTFGWGTGYYHEVDSIKVENRQ
jgi:hypothetical protein